MSKIYHRLKHNGAAHPSRSRKGEVIPAPIQANAADEDLDQLVGTLVAGAERRALEIDALRQRLETPAMDPAPAKAGDTPPAPSPPLARELARLTRELQAALAKQRAAEDQASTLRRDAREQEKTVQRLRQEQARALARADAASGDVQGLQARMATLEEQAVEANRLLEAASKELELQKGQRRKIQDLEARIAAQQDTQRLAEQAAAQAAERLAEQTREWNHKIEAAQRQAQVQEDNVRQARAAGDELTQRIVTLENELEAARRAPPAPPKAMWYLKLDDGTLLGPSEEDVLAEWARLCRIGPTHLLSRDREHWVAAASIPALGMDWMVELMDGNRYGPINLCAVTVLMADGSVRPEASLRNPKTGMVLKAGDAAIPEALRAIETAETLRRELAAFKTARALNTETVTAHTVPPPKSVRTEAWRRLKAAPPASG